MNDYKALVERTIVLKTIVSGFEYKYLPNIRKAAIEAVKGMSIENGIWYCAEDTTEVEAMFDCDSDMENFQDYIVDDIMLTQKALAVKNAEYKTKEEKLLALEKAFPNLDWTEKIKYFGEYGE